MAENLKRLDGESMYDWEKRAMAQFPNQWIVLDSEEMLFHSAAKDEALSRYRTIVKERYTTGVLPPDYVPVHEGLIRARG